VVDFTYYEPNKVFLLDHNMSGLHGIRFEKENPAILFPVNILLIYLQWRKKIDK